MIAFQCEWLTLLLENKNQLFSRMTLSHVTRSDVNFKPFENNMNERKKIIGINIEYYRKGPENLSIARAFIWHLY